MMNAKEKAINHLTNTDLSYYIPMNTSKRAWKFIYKSLDIAILETKKEVFSDIEKCRTRIQGLLTNKISFHKYYQTKGKHLNTRKQSKKNEKETN